MLKQLRILLLVLTYLTTSSVFQYSNAWAACNEFDLNLTVMTNEGAAGGQVFLNSGSPTPAGPSPDSVSTVFTFDENTQVTLTQTPFSGYQFVKWTVDGIDSTNASIATTMSSNRTVVALFEEIKNEMAGNNPDFPTTVLPGGGLRITAPDLAPGEIINAEDAVYTVAATNSSRPTASDFYIAKGDATSMTLKISHSPQAVNYYINYFHPVGVRADGKPEGIEMAFARGANGPVVSLGPIAKTDTYTVTGLPADTIICMQLITENSTGLKSLPTKISTGKCGRTLPA